MDLDLEATKARLEHLRSEHRDLDDAIARISESAPFDNLQIQRLKKRKLVLKDLIAKLESQIVPDTIASAAPSRSPTTPRQARHARAAALGVAAAGRPIAGPGARELGDQALGHHLRLAIVQMPGIEGKE